MAVGIPSGVGQCLLESFSVMVVDGLLGQSSEKQRKDST